MAIGTTAAILGAAAIGGVTSIASGMIGSKAAGKAADAQVDSADKSLALQAAMYDQNRADAMPWMTAGRQALDMYMGELTGFDKEAYLRENPEVAPAGYDAWDHYQKFGKAQGRNRPTYESNFQKTPGYDFMVEEGERGITNNMAALGMKNSGAALKALTRFRTGLADQTYNNYLDRLSGVSTGGQTQVGNTGALGANAASNMGATMMDAGTARASGYVGGANAWTNALTNIGKSGGYALGWAA